MKLIKNKNEIKFCSLFKLVNLNPENIKKDTKLINYVDISSTKNGKILSHKKINSKDGFPSRAKRKVRLNDIIYSTVRPYLKGHAIVKEDNLTVSTGFAVLRPEFKGDASFVFYSLMRNEDKIVGLCKGGNYPAINGGDLAKVEILDLPVNERKSISKLLDKQQSLIDNYKEKLSLLEKQESYYQDELLSGRLRIRLTKESIDCVTNQGWYKDNDIVKGKEEYFENWIKDGFEGRVEFYLNQKCEKVCLNNMKTKKPLDWMKKNLAYYQTKLEKGRSGEKYLEIGDIDIKNKTYDISNKQKKSVDTAKKALKGTILFSTVRPTRLSYTILKEDMMVSNAFCPFIEKNGLIKFLLNQKKYKYFVERFSEGGTYPTIKNQTIYKYDFIMPTKNSEIILIVCFLNNFNKLIQLIEKKIEIEEKRMEYLMDELLSGRIRIEE